MKHLKAFAATMSAVASVAIVGHAFAADTETIKWALWDWDKTAYYQPLIDAYQAKHPNVKIDYVDLGSTDYQTMLSTQLTGGADDLDVLTIKDVPGYATVVRAGQLEDLTGYMKDNAIDPAAYSGLIEQITIKDKVYALPFRSDFWVVYYNKDLFDKAGVPYPSNDMTVAQYDELARKMTSGAGSDKVYGSIFHIWRSTVELFGILDGQHTVVDGNYDFLKPWYERALKLQSDGIVPDYSMLKTSNTHYSAPFFNNTIATLPMGTWFAATQITKVKSGESKSVNWGIVKYPHPDGVKAGTTIATITSLAVNKQSSHKETALDFLKFVTGPEGATIVASTGTIPAVRDAKVIDTITSIEGFPKDENSKAALTIEKGYLEMPVHPKAPQIEVALNRVHDSIMTKNETVEEGIAEMNKTVGNIIGQ
ncbi:sugar ABC transporter substrate-binding protein [Pleomorphomonas sp. PLEO]|uniref:ABC transporter substrate-binding protein n=1 Tax=Pleomorphomonas sp. PLEO TaxID=3239306 RepID=UPI00351EAD55